MREEATTPQTKGLRSSAPYFILVLSLLMTAAVTYSTAKTAAARDQHRFDDAVHEVSEDIKGRMATYIAILRASTGLFAASDGVDLEEFQRFVAQLELPGRHPGVQGLGYSARVRPDELDAFVAEARAHITPEFAVHPMYQRPEYHAILYLEPLDRRNKAAVGYDMFSEPARRAAMQQARDTGEPSASGKVMLVQEIDEQKQAGFLIYMPIYTHGWPTLNISERQAALKGFTYSPFRADDLLRPLLREDVSPLINFQVYDGATTTDESLLFTSNRAASPAEGAPRLRATSTLEIAGHTWTLLTTSGPAFEAGSSQPTSRYVFGTGALLSLLLFGVTRAQVSAREAAERNASDLARSTLALRQSEQYLRDVLDGVPVFVALLSPEGELIEVNRAMLDAMDLPSHSQDVLGKALLDAPFWPPAEEAKAVREELKAAIARAQEGERVRWDAPLRAAGDRSLMVEMTLTALRGKDGAVTSLVLTCTDITERLSAERERAKLSEEVIHMQSARLAELSTPLIPLGREIVLMPLIGTIDAARAQQMLEAIAQGVASRRARTAIVDITGVPTVDTHVASVLLRTADVVRLLGTELVLTGINPEVAQALVRLEVSLTRVVTRGDLESGIEYALGRAARRSPGAPEAPAS